MQINQASLVRAIDDFIRAGLFNEPFDPLADNNWRVLLLSQAGVTQHIVKEVSRIIYERQNRLDVREAAVIKRYFSEVAELKMRENFSLPITKTIYERLPYPANKGELEHQFMLFCDSDGQVDSFLKISEHYHTFAHLFYIRTDGMLSSYYPDFIVQVDGTVYLVETKALKDLTDPNVRQKERAALDWIGKVNELKPDDRMGCEWCYALLGETTFYSFRDKGASVKEVLDFARLTQQRVNRSLF